MHGPEVADTNTSWLKACRDDGDCAGNARCLSNLCTLSCSDARPNPCRQVSAQAFCDQANAICDVSCSDDAACTGLAANLVCQAGSCREPSALSAGAQTLQLATDLVSESGMQPNDMDSAWLGDRWRVAVRSSGPNGVMFEEGVTPVSSSISLTDVFPDGQLAQDYATNDSLSITNFGPLLVGQDGRVLEMVRDTLERADKPRKCQMRFYGPGSLTQLHVVEDDCSPDNLPASLDAEGDWLLFRQRSEGPNTRSVYAQLYQPEAQTWGSSVQVLKRDFSVGVLKVQVESTQRVTLHWFEPTGNGVVATLSQEELSTSPRADAWRNLGVKDPPAAVDGQLFGWSLVSGQWLLPSSYVRIADDGAGHWRAVALRLNADAAPSLVALELALKDHQISSSAEHTLCPVPERNLLAYLHVEDPGPSGGAYTLWLHLFDGEGKLQTSPVLLASNERDLRNCKLSWSGEAFLATWSEGWPTQRPVARVVGLAPGLDASGSR